MTRFFRLRSEYSGIVSEKEFPELANVKDSKDLRDNHQELLDRIDKFVQKHSQEGDFEVYEVDEDGEIIN
jgi:hypothetical protein